MRAEDLFEAIGELDEQLIALSEEDGQRARKASDTRDHQKEIRAKRKKRAQIYRFAVIAMTTAAAVFAVLTARDLLTARSRSYSQTAAESYAESAAEAAQDTVPGVLASGTATDEEDAVVEPDANMAAKDSAAQDTGQAEEAEENAVAEVAEEIEEAAVEIAEAEEALEDENAGKTAVDLLGNLKGGYVKLEFISAEDAANGGETSVPEYTKEREEALSSALENGEKRAAMFTDEGEPIYYVYLTRTDGKVDVVTFYDKGYVSMNTVPGVVLKLSDEAFAAVLEVFEN